MELAEWTFERVLSAWKHILRYTNTCPRVYIASCVVHITCPMAHRSWSFVIEYVLVRSKEPAASRLHDAKFGSCTHASVCGNDSKAFPATSSFVRISASVKILKPNAQSSIQASLILDTRKRKIDRTRERTIGRKDGRAIGWSHPKVGVGHRQSWFCTLLRYLWKSVEIPECEGIHWQTTVRNVFECQTVANAKRLGIQKL